MSLAEAAEAGTTLEPEDYTVADGMAHVESGAEPELVFLKDCVYGYKA